MASLTVLGFRLKSLPPTLIREIDVQGGTAEWKKTRRTWEKKNNSVNAFRGWEGVSVFMLSPLGRMSEVQRAQMYSLADANIHNIAVEGR